MNKNYQRGRAFEYKVIKELEKEGYLCIRSAGSHTKIDIVAFLIKEGKELPLIKVIQCKAGNSPYKKNLLQLTRLNLPVIVQKEIWIKKPHQKIQKILC